MGMFDSFYDANGDEWQTKAFDCLLDVYRIGERVPPLAGRRSLLTDYQVEIMGGPIPSGNRDSFVTVRNRVVDAIDVPRDTTLPLVTYHGEVVTS